MNNSETKSQVQKTIQRAEEALKLLIIEGMRVSQHAVEMRAGLSNGTLNYDVQEYRDFKTRLSNAKQATTSRPHSGGDSNNKKLKTEIALKKKYRDKYNAVRSELRQSKGKELELTYQLFHLQRYVDKLEEQASARDVTAIER